MHSSDQQPPGPTVTSEDILKALGMNLSWGNTPILRLPTVFNPQGSTQPTQANPWPALAAPTPIHPNNPLPGLLDSNLFASLLRLPQPLLETEVKQELCSTTQPQPTQGATQTFTAIPEQNRLAALKLQEKIRNEAGGQALIFSTPDPTPESSPPSTYTRAPGHGASEEDAPTPESLVCPDCGFACTSKFHFNSHMNTHGDFKCKICDYKTRTEGRVIKHMREAHTQEEQLAFGVDPNVSPSPSASTTPGTTISSSPSSSKELSPECGEDNVFQIPTAPPMDTTPTVPKTPRKQKPKRYQCKHCEYVSTNKNERYEHSKTHIPLEKQLCCPQCEFVTEYKHHLEYHIRNHYGSKPFTCEKCQYTCVNKSMLNSHLKSHSTEYQFKCQDCTYATKYCHSLKLHLRKYGHRRLLTEDDMKSPQTSAPASVNGEMRDLDDSYAALLNPNQLDASNTLQALLPCSMCGFQTSDSNEQLQHNLQHLLNGTQASPSLSLPPVSVAAPVPLPVSMASSANLLESLFSTPPTTNTVVPVAPPVTVEVKVEVDRPEDVPMEECKVENDFRQACLDQLSQIQELQQKYRWQCDQCQVSFMDEALCKLHLKCHGAEAPFKCASCPFNADNALAFNQHIVQGHQNVNNN